MSNTYAISAERAPIVTSRRALPWLNVALASCAFLWIEIAAQSRTYERIVDAALPGGVEPYGRFLLARLAFSVPPFAALMMAGVVLASRGARRTFFLPALAFFGIAPVAGALTGASAIATPLSSWAASWGYTSTAALWLQSAADLALILLPAAAVASVSPARERRAGWSAGAVALALAVSAIIVTTRSVVVSGGGALPGPGDMTLFVSLFLFGAMSARHGARGVWPVAAVVFLIAPSLGGAGMLMLGAAGEQVPLIPMTLAPFALVAFAGASIQAMSRLVAAAGARPRVLLVAVNALNVADALLTALAVGVGQAVEANPIVRAVGLPAKVVIVAVASRLIYRTKPRALLWPAMVLLAVLAYHAAGAVVNA